MKITVSIEANPEEIRDALGLPNMEKLQKVVMDQIASKVTKENLDVGSLMDVLMPKSIQIGKKFMDVAMNSMDGKKSSKKEE